MPDEAGVPAAPVAPVVFWAAESSEGFSAPVVVEVVSLLLFIFVSN